MNDEVIDFEPVGKAFSDKVSGKNKKADEKTKLKQKRQVKKTKLEQLDEVDEREDFDSDEEEREVDIDQMLLGDRAKKGKSESFKRVEGELAHL